MSSPIHDELLVQRSVRELDREWADLLAERDRERDAEYWAPADDGGDDE